MTVDAERDYIDEVHLLKGKYFEKIDVFCGIELDSYNNSSLRGYDYVLGSHHYFKIDDEYRFKSS